MSLIPNDWEHLLITETSQNSLLKFSATTIKSLGKYKTPKNSLSCINVFIFFFPQTLQYTEWATHQIFCVLDVKNKKSLNPNLYFIACFSEFLQTFHQLRLIIRYINLKYTFNIPFIITLKTIIMGTCSQFHDGAQLKFYPNLAQRYYTSGLVSKNLC